jgi:4,5-dihydroxyphthalate decarboxylase
VTRLTIAGFSYFDRSHPLKDHSASVEGLDYDYTVLSAPDLGRRVFVEGEFDAGELWAASHICELAAGRSRYVALPVFPSRNFRHGFVFVREDSGIRTPRDLVGRRVGAVEYVQTAAVWIRAFLQHDFGVSPVDIDWVLTRQRTHAPVPPPAGVRASIAEDDRRLEALLLDGVVDAAIGAFNHRTVLEGPVRRLFERPKDVALDYYRRTGVFPIMHFLGLRRDVYEAHPEAAMQLVRLYEEAKRIGLARLERTSSLAVSLPWLEDHLEETRAVFGQDPFRYGLRANRPTLERLTQHVHEQGLSPRRMAVEELFAPETLDT